MEEESLIKSLHPLEVRVLLSGAMEHTAADLVGKLGYKLGQALQALSWLHAKGLVEEKGRVALRFFEITELGRLWSNLGFPEQRLFQAVVGSEPKTLAEWGPLLEMEQSDLGSAFGRLSKENFLGLNEFKQVIVKNSTPPSWMEETSKLLKSAAKSESLNETSLTSTERELVSGMAKKRGAATSAFRTIEREEITYNLTSDGLEAAKTLKARGVTGEEVGRLTPEMLQSGSWKTATFRAYNVNTAPVRTLMGRRNPYSAFLMDVKDKLVSLGFEEFDGPLVETEFWNGDALFMPQFHSARDIHDVYYVKNPTHAREIEQPWLDQVADAHENGAGTGSRGWGYSFDKDFTRRLILRSQGTVLSAKQLPTAKVPGKYFGIARCFRYDQVDATHGADFYQTEGIVLGEDVNLRTLLGLLEMFAVEIAGATEVKYVPGYFPFTEPSIEVHIKHPVLGWFELGGSGIFRPEVTKPLGIHVPVLAWGLGIDRMALMQLGLNDLRELFTPDIEKVRLRRSKGA